MDEGDVAQRLEELALQQALRNKKAEPLRLGRCLYCNALVEGRFCDADCADDWAQEQSVLRRQGR